MTGFVRSGAQERTNMIHIALLGTGVVGGGVWTLLRQNAEDLRQRAGCELKLKRVLVRSPHKALALGIPESLLTQSLEDIVNDPEIGIVIELMGGTGFAGEAVEACLKKGKSVVTANKDLIAKRGEALSALAREQGCDLYYEASVGGGIPLIGPLKRSLCANRFSRVTGILNGTTNYMLSEMSEKKISYDQALSEAQALGFAESDPTNDVDGLDAGRKIAILASIAFNAPLPFEKVVCEGIRAVKQTDISHSAKMGYAIKLLASAWEEDGALRASVHPALIPFKHPLSAVSGAYNAVYLRGDAVGQVMLYGQGAGALPTASAVVSDVVEAARNLQTRGSGCQPRDIYRALPLPGLEDTQSVFYLRLLVKDHPGVLAGIAGVFGDHGISLASVIQSESTPALAELIIITHRCLEGSMQTALKILAQKPFVDSVQAVLRVENP